MIRPAWDPSGTPTLTGITEVDARVRDLNQLQRQAQGGDPHPWGCHWVDIRDDYEPSIIQWHYGLIAAVDGSAYRRHRTGSSWGCVLEPGTGMVTTGMFARVLDIKPRTLTHDVRRRLPLGNPYPEADSRPDGSRRLWMRHTVFLSAFDRPGPGWRSDLHLYDRHE